MYLIELVKFNWSIKVLCVINAKSLNSVVLHMCIIIIIIFVKCTEFTSWQTYS